MIHALVSSRAGLPPRARTLGLLLVALACAPGTRAAVAAPPPEPLAHFITRVGDQLHDGSSEFRFVSINLPDILQIITHYQFDGDYATSRYRLPNEFELRDGVRTARQMGGRVIRTFTITTRSGPSPHHMFDVAPLPVVPNEAALRVIDRLLQVCHEEGVRLIIPLIAYNSQIRGDPSTYGEDFWVIGSPANRRFKSMVTQLLGRTNHYTGVPYRDDPAILAWQTGNELVIGDDPARRAWLHDFAAFLKALDPNHLVIDGRNRPADVYPRYEEFLVDENLDAVSYHTYRNLPEADTPRATLRLIRELTRGRKPLLVTEIAMHTPPDTLRELLAELIGNGTVGANWWALRFHNRDGGFYKHSDKQSQFEDLNWPGFASAPGLPGEIARERELLGILSAYAWRIQGRTAPPPVAPAAPHLLPIPDVGHISWQGSTGASHYTVQRAETPAGPWRDLADNLGDHLIANAAQFCDRTALLGGVYHYRVIAHNHAGASPPSAASAPVAVDRLWLIDELFDLRLAAPDSHNLRVEQAYAHTSYLEDLAVALRADPTQPAELVYRLPRAMREFTATIFDADTPPRVFLLEADDTRREVQPMMASYDGGKRRRLSLRLDGDVRALAIQLSAAASPTQAIGRVEIATAD